MNLYLSVLGWWNLIGSGLLLCMLNEPFGNKVLVTWTAIFKEEFTLGYYGRLWLFWAAGLNIIFALINIMAAKWNHPELKSFMMWADVISYTLFIGLSCWGLVAQKCGNGIFIGFLIFGVFLGWGIFLLWSNQNG